MAGRRSSCAATGSARTWRCRRGPGRSAGPAGSAWRPSSRGGVAGEPGGGRHLVGLWNRAAWTSTAGWPGSSAQARCDQTATTSACPSAWAFAAPSTRSGHSRAGSRCGTGRCRSSGGRAGPARFLCAVDDRGQLAGAGRGQVDAGLDARREVGPRVEPAQDACGDPRPRRASASASEQEPSQVAPARARRGRRAARRGRSRRP